MFKSSPIISKSLLLFFIIVLHPFSIAEFINLCPSKDSPIIAKNTLFLFAILLSITNSFIDVTSSLLLVKSPLVAFTNSSYIIIFS